MEEYQNLEKPIVLHRDWDFVICSAAYYMEQPSERWQEPAWRADFQRKYLRRLVAMLRRDWRIEPATNASTGSRTVKFASDLSLAMTSRVRTAWSRAIISKYLFKVRKSRCQLRGVKIRGNQRGVRRSAYAKTGPCKTTAVCKKVGRRLHRIASKTNHKCEQEAGGTVASRMRTLRMLVPGSHGLDTPVFLKDAADYIVALKMQVQAMQALADCYSDSSAHSATQV